MNITLDTLRSRKSVRTFSAPCDAAQIKRLNAVITDINTHGAGMHFQLVTNEPNAFGSFSKSYGMFKGVTDYVACVVDTSFANWLARAGFYGMQIVCEATAMGLGSCFVSATYSQKDVGARVRVGQELVMLIALGQKTEVEKKSFVAKLSSAMMHRHKRLTPMDFLDTTLPWEKICAAFPKLYEGLEAVSYAPSAYNKQPVGIFIKEAADPANPVAESVKSDKSAKKSEHAQELSSRYDALLHPKVTASADTQSANGEYILQAYVPPKNRRQLIDLGIAMYSFSCIYPGTWDWGNPATFLPY
ncbi:MAG: hypothetical protein NC402_03085 [Prevotella sp.]|nr:hypothetical protein [Prevotella sp.]MCM1075109.1 hypothetical protein [Ruminococcus sp.]